MGPPAAYPPPLAYAPPPAKKGILLLLLGLVLLLISAVLIVVGIGGVGKAVSNMGRVGAGANTFLAPGEHTLTLEAGEQWIMSIDNGDFNGQTYALTEEFPTSATVFKVTAPDGSDVPTTPAVRAPSNQAARQPGDQTFGFSTRSVRAFDATVAGQYRVSVTNPQGMEPRPINVVAAESFEGAMEGGVSAVRGFVCGGFFGVLGFVIVIVWIIVRK